MLLAIVVGMIVSSIIRTEGSLPKQLQEGVNFSAKTLLKLGIVFLGVRLNFLLIAQLGIKLVLANLIVIILGLISIELIGRKLKLTASLRRTLAIGSSICGATAVAASLPVLKPKDEETGVTIATISILGTLAVFVYLPLAQVLTPSDLLYGAFVGATLPEMGQVMAAGYSFSSEAGDTALLVKLMRVAMLVPVLFFFSFLERKESLKDNNAEQPPLIPWFLAGFLILGVLNSFGFVPEQMKTLLVQLSLYLTAIAMAAIGLGVNVRAFGRLGGKAVFASLLGLTLIGIFMLPFSAFVLH